VTQDKQKLIYKLTGKKNFEIRTSQSFNSLSIEFLNEFSNELKKYKNIYKYPDLVYLLFWCNKKKIEKISIIDKFPNLVKLYNKFGIIAPDKIDLENRRLHWNLDSLNKDETRIFTYIIYSKIGVVGKFELPEAKAVYEDEGEVKEAISNRSFYLRDE